MREAVPEGHSPGHGAGHLGAAIGRISLALLGLLLAFPTMPVAAQSPSASPGPSVAPVPVVGPDGSGAAPAPPIGEPWTVMLDARTGQYWSDAVVCGGGFTVVGYGRDREDRQRAQTWISADGTAWEQGETLRPAPGTDPYWLVTDLLMFHGALFALGGDDRQLAVWRSTDCGRDWRRLRDPSFGLGADACCISQGVEAAATGDRLLVLAHQGGEEIPGRRWAWVMDAGGGWRQLPGGLEAALDGSVGSTGTSFFAVHTVTGEPDGRSLVVSPDGETWTTAGTLPPYSVPVWDGYHGRYLAVTQEPHDAPVAPPILWTSPDGVAWTVLYAGTPSAVTYGSAVAAERGLLVWIVDAGDGSDDGSWSWIATSADGGTTWSVSAGWPRQTLQGGKSIAISPDATVIAGGPLDRTRIWMQPRGSRLSGGSCRSRAATV